MRLGVMCSGNGTNFENIVHSCPKHDVVLMVYNKKKAKAAKRAERLDIPSCYCKNEDDIITQTEKSLEKYGYNKDDFKLVPQPDGTFKVVPNTDKEESSSDNIEENTENKLGFLKLPKSLSTDDLLEFLIDEPIFNQKVIQNRKNELSLNNNINSVDSLSPNVSVNNLVAQLPLDSFSGSTQIIDLRKAEEIVGGNDTAASSATSQLDTAIADLDPSRKLSVYESFVRSV